MRATTCFALLTALALSACGGAETAPDDAGSPTSAPAEETAETRTFRIRYVTKLEGLPGGETARLWIPVPQDDEHQTIGVLKVEGPWDHALTVEPVWGNRMLYLEGRPLDGDPVEVVVEYEVERREATTDASKAKVDGEEPTVTDDRFLTGSTLVVADDAIRAAHEQVTPANATTWTRARAYYDRVMADMSYDKSGEGWGRGDSVFACEVGKGNCTDFHAYFQALCMLEKVPSQFAIGLYGPYDRRVGETVKLGGYHCWASFHVPGYGWVPVDVSEADKDPSKADYFFGSHSDNRVTLSRGRDLVLEPAQDGPPLNFLVNPYAEVGGKPFAGVTKTATWQDLR